jgi:hypothetical protein
VHNLDVWLAAAGIAAHDPARSVVTQQCVTAEQQNSSSFIARVLCAFYVEHTRVFAQLKTV